jgi:hypothetical protein
VDDIGAVGADPKIRDMPCWGGNIVYRAEINQRYAYGPAGAGKIVKVTISALALPKKTADKCAIDKDAGYVVARPANVICAPEVVGKVVAPQSIGPDVLVGKLTFRFGTAAIQAYLHETSSSKWVW